MIRGTICALLLLLCNHGSYTQPSPTVIPDDFDETSLFEYQLKNEWYFFPESADLTVEEALNGASSFLPFPGDSVVAGWWMLQLRNESDIRDFSLRFMSAYDDLLIIKEHSNGSISRDVVGNQVLKPGARVQVRLLTTSFSIEPGEQIRILVRNDAGEVSAPSATLNELTAVEDYSRSLEKISLVFTVIFTFIFIYQIGMAVMIRSKSYAYYGLLAFGYLLHAFNYQLDGWVTASFAADFSIISASIICVAGISLWRRFLKIEQGSWLWVFRILKTVGLSIIVLVMSFMTFPTLVPRLDEFASLAAALLALIVISVWMVSSVIMSIQGRENARSFLLTNLPLFVGGLFFIGIWLGAQYQWIDSVSSIAIGANLIFFGSALAQLLLFSLVMGLAMKRKLTGSYKNEKQRKLVLEERVKERTNELQEINQQLMLKNQELEKTNATKNRLLTILSHDLRSPINNVASLITLLKEHQFSPEEFSSLIPELEKSIADTTSFMSLLIGWTQSQNDGLVPNRTMFSIQSVIDRNIRHLDSAIEAKQLELKIEATNLEVFADKNMTDLVVRNLLSNAIKFSRPNGKIEISAIKKLDEKIKISISDLGVGIDGKRADQFFDVGKKNTTMGTAGEKGFGMGLILCKDFVELNDGTLDFESEKGTGSTFWFEIPCNSNSTQVI